MIYMILGNLIITELSLLLVWHLKLFLKESDVLIIANNIYGNDL